MYGRAIYVHNPLDCPRQAPILGEIVLLAIRHGGKTKYARASFIHHVAMASWPRKKGIGIGIVAGLLTWPPRSPIICYDGLRLLRPINRRPLYGDTREEIGTTAQYEAIELSLGRRVSSVRPGHSCLSDSPVIIIISIMLQRWVSLSK